VPDGEADTVKSVDSRGKNVVPHPGAFLEVADREKRRCARRRLERKTRALTIAGADRVNAAHGAPIAHVAAWSD
jgi:hypothetical protein